MPTDDQGLHDLLYAGLFRDIGDADHHYELVRAIGRRSEEVNQSGFGSFFGMIQGTLQSAYVLAVSRIYDPPPRQYPTRSIRAVVHYLAQNAKGLRIQAPGAIVDRIRKLSPVTQMPDPLEPERFTRQVACVIGDALLARQASVDKVRMLRDKRIAHNEAVDTAKLVKPTWNEAHELLALARDVAVIVGHGYLTTICEDGTGAWILDSGPRGRAYELNKVIDFVVEGHQREVDILRGPVD